ncbi:hypothetical protein [Candidatus Protochlamydia phocaeensis]|uniref:hypothetical protein n=1 Tax=Candidatus Protochlamydia phocaeensis TaxID=1414722 RepID=UPI000B1AC0FB|nr:hypothetical protein [Candidatus Protochlamydia phocaeensis]
MLKKLLSAKLRLMIFLGLFQLALSSCVFQRLSVQTHYLSHENLASYYVYTPDPHLDNPIIGQRLLIQWSLPSSYCAYDDLALHLKVRLRNHKEETISLPLKSMKGTYLYYVVNEAYCESGGVATYKIDVTGGGCVLETWKHPLWVDLITFNIPQEEKPASP